MRVFVVLASLVALISADVSHLTGGHKTTTYTHSVPSYSYGSTGYSSGSDGFSGSNGAYHSGSSGFGSSGYAADPVQVNYVQYPATQTTHHYVKPAVQTTTHYVQQAPAVQTHYVQQAAPVVHTVSRFSGDGGFGSSGFGSGATYTQGSGFGGGATYGSGFSGSSGFGGSSFGGSNLYDSSSSYGGGHSTYRTTLVKQTAPIVTKSSYVFAAPEDKEDIQRDQTIVLPRPRVHYNAVFIKAPASTVVNTPSVALAPQTQEKTLIYVLSDKKRIENHIQLPQLDAPAKVKPDVFFVKYNKPTEKINSQVRYETVNAVNGAEFGAHNGVANAGGNLHSRIADTVSTGEDSHVAHTIYQGLQHQGLQGGLNAFDTLQGQGISVGNAFADSASTGSFGGSSGSFGGSSGSFGGSSFGTTDSFPSSGSYVETVKTVQKPATVSYTTTTTNTGSSGNGGQYYTGFVPAKEGSYSTTTYESGSNGAGSNGAGSSFGTGSSFGSGSFGTTGETSYTSGSSTSGTSAGCTSC